MSIYVTIDLDSLMCKLSDKELYDFMLETFRDRVPDESHISLITEMFKVMFDTDREDALAAMLTSMGENALPTIKDAGGIEEWNLQDIFANCFLPLPCLLHHSPS